MDKFRGKYRIPSARASWWDYVRDAAYFITICTKNKFGPQRKNPGSVIGGFKSAVTTDARLIIPSLGWQARFRDHIIRDEGEYRRIANYIRKNPENLKNDNFYDNNKS